MWFVIMFFYIERTEVNYQLKLGDCWTTVL